MEHYIVKGKHAQLNWTFHSIAGEEFSLAGHTYRLYYSAGRGRTLATGVTHADNVLTWSFTPNEQWKNGHYDLEVEVLRDGSKIVTVTYPDAFVLVPSASPFVNYDGDTTAIQDDVSTINILSSCDINKFAPLAPVIGSDGKWYIDGQVVLDDDDNPVYADSTIDIENDGTIVVNRGRHNEYTITSLKTALLTAASDHGTAVADHNTAVTDHNTAAFDHTMAASDHNTAASDHNTAASDHTTAAADHGVAIINAATAATDHTNAVGDHSTAYNDHTTAVADHNTAVTDHNRYLGMEANIPSAAQIQKLDALPTNSELQSALSSKADSSSVHSVPSGGTTGQVLAKASGTDFDLEWVEQSGGGSGTDTEAVHFTEQSLNSTQKAQARSNIGAGTYSKPSGGIPSTDIASGVIPDVSNFITKSVNDLTNYYLKTETYNQTEINNLIGAINQFHYEIAASTSAVTSPASNVLYLIGPTGSGADKYEEYVYPNSTTGWVKIGETSIDLSGKADKVDSATSGNFAGLDSNGNLVDSGHKHSDYLTSHQDISGKEDSSNKVSSWSSTTTDTHYPSEKLVKDSLDGKQTTLVGSGTGQNIKTVNNTSLLGTGNIDAQDVFWVTFGTTTYSEVATAVAAGKVVCMYYEDQFYTLQYDNTEDNEFAFVSIIGTNTLCGMSLYNDDSWGGSDTTIPSVASLTTSEIDTIWNTAMA